MERVVQDSTFGMPGHVIIEMKMKEEFTHFSHEPTFE